ncbi:MAG: hypothetical protein LBU89_04845 [Fibromonadaceae bacterium]|nr:hypothetical protein [Fibromonadaceae bacterium]
MECPLIGKCEKTFPIKYSTFTDERDGRIYRTVRINKLEWMDEDLKYYYKGSDKPIDEFGRRYTYHMTQLVMPSGWRLPKLHEWENSLKSGWLENSHIMNVWWLKNFGPTFYFACANKTYSRNLEEIEASNFCATYKNYLRCVRGIK